MNSAVAAADTWFGSPPPAAVMQTLARSVDPETLRAVLRAIEGRLQLDVDYQSLTETRRRKIGPHSLAFDGYRWHTRAWCAEHNDFRDFVLSRMLSIRLTNHGGADPTNDVEWNTFLDLKIVAHPALDDAQKSAIERDYGMTAGTLVVKLRAALAFYLIRRLNLDLKEGVIPPSRQQIHLSNLLEVDETVRTAKEETRRRASLPTV